MSFTSTEIMRVVKYCGYIFNDYGISQVTLLLNAVTTRGTIYEAEVRSILADVSAMDGNARTARLSGDAAQAISYQQEAQRLIYQMAALANLSVNKEFFAVSQGRINRA